MGGKPRERRYRGEMGTGSDFRNLTGAKNVYDIQFYSMFDKCMTAVVGRRFERGLPVGKSSFNAYCGGTCLLRNPFCPRSSAM